MSLDAEAGCWQCIADCCCEADPDHYARALAELQRIRQRATDTVRDLLTGTPDAVGQEQAPQQ